MKVYLDNNPVKYPTDSLLKPKFTIRRSNENGESSISFTGDIEFIKDDYDYIKAKLIDSQNAINENIILKFVNDCCGNKEYLFQIKPESLEWCEGSCQISANALEYSPDAQAYACVNNTLIWDNWNNFMGKNHPRIAYCLEFRPNILQDAMLIFGLLTVSMSAVLYPVLLVVQTLVNTVNFIIDAVNNLPGVNISKIAILGNTSNTSILQWAQDLSKTIAGFVAGCNYNHPSPLVRDYIKNVCDKCGLQFNSSILNNATNDYYNTVYFSAQVKKGQSQGDVFFGAMVNFIQRNRPIHNGKSFLDEIKQVFNAKWDIHNGVIRFERRDYFKKQNPWFNITTGSEKVIKECYSWTKKPRPAYASIGYQTDALDWAGSEAVERWSDTIEWNNPVNPMQKGEFKRVFPFGAARFRNDGLDRDVLAAYDWMPFGIGDVIKANKDVLLLNSGTANLPKLLILRPGTAYNHALVNNTYTAFADNIDTYRENVYPNETYNYPYWVREGLKNNLYDRFWAIENPRSKEWSGFDYNLQLKFDCELLDRVDIDGTVRVTKGIGEVEIVELDFETNTMTIKGEV